MLGAAANSRKLSDNTAAPNTPALTDLAPFAHYAAKTPDADNVTLN